MIKKIVLASLISSSLIAAPSGVDFSGKFLGLGAALDNGNKSAQFDYAMNLDGKYQFNENAIGGFQLQTGAGNGLMGLGGPGVVLTDLYMTFSCPKDKHGTLTIGSFDTPFGQQTAHLSNNGDVSKSAFIVNPLLYNAFVRGPLGTLNTLGMMHTRNIGKAEVIAALSNGSGENAINDDMSAELTLQVNSGEALELATVGASYMTSNDTNDAANMNANSFKVDFTGTMVDVHSSPMENLNLKAYWAQLNYTDNNANTDNDVTSLMIEAAYTHGKWTPSFRLSTWAPTKSTKSATMYSPLLPTPGFFSSAANEDTTRFQLGLKHQCSDNINVRSEIIYETRETSSNSGLALVAVTGSF